MGDFIRRMIEESKRGQSHFPVWPCADPNILATRTGEKAENGKSQLEKPRNGKLLCADPPKLGTGWVSSDGM